MAREYAVVKAPVGAYSVLPDAPVRCHCTSAVCLQARAGGREAGGPGVSPRSCWRRVLRSRAAGQTRGRGTASGPCFIEPSAPGALPVLTMQECNAWAVCVCACESSGRGRPMTSVTGIIYDQYD